jgi:segregation and condensation protein B
MDNYHKIIEALLFASNSPLTDEMAKECIADPLFQLDKVVKELNEKYMKKDNVFYINKISNGYVLKTKEEYHSYISKLYNNKKKWFLSKQSLEALSIIAYKQPITKSEVEYIRGVSSDYIIKTLLEKELITIKGRDQSIGKPLLYGTSQKFLEAFGIDTISDLPNLKDIDGITGL